MGKERETIRERIEQDRSTKRARNEKSDTLQIEITPLAEQMAHAGREGKRHFLVIFDGMNMGNHIPLDEKPVVLGRDESCDVVIDDAGISRRHAQIQLTERGKLQIEDLKSTNGTYVKGKRVAAATLNVGAKVLFGQRTLARFVMEDPLDRIYQQTLWSSCIQDGLTGISNRTYLKKRIESADSFAKRQQVPYSLMLFSLDNLDEINRTYGMQVGDQTLVMVVRIISDIIRNEDVFSRYARDELAVLSVGCDMHSANALAERVCREVCAKRVNLPDDSGATVAISLSAGLVTVFERSVLDTPAVLSQATENLVAAKQRQGDHRKVVATCTV